MKRLLGAVLFGAIYVLPIWAAPRFGVDPLVAWLAVSLTVLLLFVILILLVRVPIRGTAESSTVFPGTPEQLFQIATDIKLSLQVNPNRGRLISQTGPPGQPGSSYVTQISGGVWTTTLVSSDPPRKLVTTITGPGTWRMDREVTYTPVAEGTRSESRTRVRMPLLYWLLQPVSNRRAKAEGARWDARVKDYLAAGAANTGGVGD